MWKKIRPANSICFLVTKNFIFFVILALSFDVFGQKNKIEELFVWKVSESLKLTPSEEKKFTVAFRGLSLKKNELNISLQDLSKTMKAAKTNQEKTVKLAEYKKTLQEYNKINIDEFEQMRNLFGDLRMVEYLYLKSDFTIRIKELIMSDRPSEIKIEKSDGSEKQTVDKKKLPKATLPTPKIIEEP